MSSLFLTPIPPFHFSGEEGSLFMRKAFLNRLWAIRAFWRDFSSWPPSVLNLVLPGYCKVECMHVWVNLDMTSSRDNVAEMMQTCYIVFFRYWYRSPLSVGSLAKAPASFLLVQSSHVYIFLSVSLYKGSSSFVSTYLDRHCLRVWIFKLLQRLSFSGGDPPLCFRNGASISTFTC